MRMILYFKISQNSLIFSLSQYYVGSLLRGGRSGRGSCSLTLNASVRLYNAKFAGVLIPV